MVKRLIKSMIVVSIVMAFSGGCGKSTGDLLVGEWVGVENPVIYWAKISKTADGFTWEGPEGKFGAAMDGGMLNIDFEGFPAYATYDKNTGHMNFIVHGQAIEYKRKE